MREMNEIRERNELENNLRKRMDDRRKELGRHVPPQPVRDDRGPAKPWRPGERA